MVFSVKEPSCYKSRVILSPLLYAIRDASVVTELRTQNRDMNRSSTFGLGPLHWLSVITSLLPNLAHHLSCAYRPIEVPKTPIRLHQSYSC